MSNDFHLFAKAVNDRYTALLGGELHVVDASDIFSLYLASFPEGSNPIFRERTEHDCACCKSFVRHIGHVVRLNGDGTVSTVWDDMDSLPEPYATVARELRTYVLSLPVRDIFRTKESKYGAQQTHELIDGKSHTWNHFWGSVPAPYLTRNPEAERGTVKTNIGVFKRGLESISMSAIDQVLDLIEANALYRGAEHLSAVRSFRVMLVEYQALTFPSARDTFLWQNIGKFGALIRNTVIGTLLTDISDGVDTEKAVRSFEQKVAPLNYKRTTALITPKQIEQGLAKLAEMGLESAIERRHARLTDVSVNNVLWVNNDARSKMKGGSLASLLMESAKPATVDIKGAVDISMEDFLATIVPQATSIDVLVQNKHLTNFMSLTAPVDPEAGALFKWDNNFAWSYDGDATDSIKSRVKKAGGDVHADLRISLAWFNKDDLDLHCSTPAGEHIFYGNKAGVLDVDMNAGWTGKIVRDAVENLAFNRPKDGDYVIAVNQFSRRETTDVGFAIEVENNGVIQQFTYDRAVSGQIGALRVTVKGGVVTAIQTSNGVIGGNRSSDKWGVTTETLVPVETLMASPNHWDGQAIGHKHWFFILKGAINPEPVRGIYNEFLKGELEPHRKVFEVLGAKTKAQPAAEQLSGVGFSSTRGDSVKVVVKGSKINRAFNVQF